MTLEQTLKIKELAVKYYTDPVNPITDPHLLREKIQYDGETDYWDNGVYFTNDEVFNLVVEALNEMNNGII